MIFTIAAWLGMMAAQGQTVTLHKKFDKPTVVNGAAPWSDENMYPLNVVPPAQPAPAQAGHGLELFYDSPAHACTVMDNDGNRMKLPDAACKPAPHYIEIRTKQTVDRECAEKEYEECERYAESTQTKPYKNYPDLTSTENASLRKLHNSIRHLSYSLRFDSCWAPINRELVGMCGSTTKRIFVDGVELQGTIREVEEK